jgi:hypothetical protein
MQGWTVQRWDDNPANWATFHTWVHISTFPTRESAEAFINRAASDTQRLRIKEN